jgi:O-antigen ligase
MSCYAQVRREIEATKMLCVVRTNSLLHMNDKNLKNCFMRFAGLSIATLFLAHIVLAIVVHDIGNAILYLMLVLSLFLLAFRFRPDNARFGHLLRQYWPLYLAMSSLFLSVLLNQIHSGHFAFKYYDRSIRLAIFPLIFWLLFFVPLHQLKWLQWGLITAVFLATVKAYMLTAGGTVRTGNIGFLSIIAYSDVTFLAGLLSLISVGWNARFAKNALILKTAACATGAYATILCATRGGWLAIPFFIIFFLFFAKIRIWHKWWWCFAAIVFMTILCLSSNAVRHRVDDVRDNLVEYSQGSKDTSIGIRLQLWEAALKLFAEEPVFGVGRENYDPDIKAMADRHEVTQSLTTLAHSHNEILFNMAISGVFGMLASLALYLVPGYYFARKLGHADLQIRTTARMGCALCIGFFAFGLTDLMFFWTTLGGYYAIMVAALLVCMIKQEQAKTDIASAPDILAISPSR